MNFRDLILAHEGKRIAILGGGKPLESELVPADLYISANEHGIKVRECDYIVAMDTKHGSGRPMEKVLRQYSDAPIISPNDYGDYKPFAWPHAPRRMYSGLVAAWIAYAMGAKVVHLCWFDAYKQSPGALRKAGMFVDGIKCEVREVGGRMGIWPSYRSGERFRYTRQPELETLKGETGLTWVVAKRRTILPNGAIEAGERQQVWRDDRITRKLMKHGILEEVA